MLRLSFILFLGMSFTFVSCKNIVQKFDQQIHKSYERNNFVEQKIHLNEHEIFYYDNNKENAPILLFVHGFGGDGKISWKDQAEYFSKDYRVIIPDILWFGNSKSTATPQLKTQIDALQQLIHHLSLQNVHLVGISYGGFIALAYAKSHQKNLASLTLVDSPGAHFSDKELKAFCEKVGVDEIADAFVPTNSDEVKRMMEFSFRKKPPLPAKIRKQTLGIYLSKHPVEQRKMLEELPSNRQQFEALNITVPVFILWGEEDQIFLTSDALELQAQLDAQLEIIPKAGHALPAEQPKAFNQSLKKFIQSIP